MDNEAKLMLLRTQLYTAMQELRGTEYDDAFWALIDELHAMKPAKELETPKPVGHRRLGLDSFGS